MDEASEKKKFGLYDQLLSINTIDPSYFQQFDVKRGLRNADGTGVVAGVTNISNVHGYLISDGVKIPDEGSLTFRGYNIYDLLLGDDAATHRFNFEEIAYLLLMGELPTKQQWRDFIDVIDFERELPDGFTASLMTSSNPPDIMNVLARSVLQLYSDDPDAESRSAEHEVHTALSLISRLPRIMVGSYYGKQAKFYGGSFILHPFTPGQSTAETILSMLRPDRSFTPEEARMLDIMLCLHAEHGGANHQVRAMHADMKQNVANWEDEGAVADYLTKIVRKEAYDRSGLIYGMGHAVYTKSDPRAVILKHFASQLAAGTEFEAEFKLLETVERLAPEILHDVKGTTKDMCANVDMYSGFVYTMMGIPEDLFTPLFACGRMAGWAAHRFEEMYSAKRIIRPAYKTTFATPRPYIPIDQR